MSSVNYIEVIVYFYVYTCTRIIIIIVYMLQWYTHYAHVYMYTYLYRGAVVREQAVHHVPHFSRGSRYVVLQRRGKLSLEVSVCTYVGVCLSSFCLSLSLFS